MSAIFPLPSLPSDALCTILDYLSAREQGSLWQIGRRLLNSSLSKGVSVPIWFCSYKLMPLRTPPSAMLQHYPNLVTFELESMQCELPQLVIPWKVSILPPTIVHLRLALPNVLFRLSDITPAIKFPKVSRDGLNEQGAREFYLSAAHLEGGATT